MHSANSSENIQDNLNDGGYSDEDDEEEEAKEVDVDPSKSKNKSNAYAAIGPCLDVGTEQKY